jgi:hypothetical protein
MRGQGLGVVDSANRAHVGGHYHRCRDYWSGNRTASDFIDTC